MFGVLNINKPQGLTSHDVVARLRKILGLKKIGHLGTLDPMATGVLPVCVGNATRLIEYFPSDKRYQAELTFGITTTTLDKEGEILSQTPCPALEKKALDAILPEFTGTIEQEVPQHAAVHVNGKKLYKYAQQGIAVKAPVRAVTIHELHLTDFRPGEFPVATLEVHCGSGTYIRALARDFGNRLETGAHLSGLIRTRHGRFDLADALSLETLAEATHPEQYLIDPAHYLELPHLEMLPETDISRLQNGMPVEVESISYRHPLYLIRRDEQIIAVCKRDGKTLRPEKVFL